MPINEYVHMPTLEEYAERFKDFFHFKRDNGIIEVRMHTNDGPVHWSYQMHHALSELWTTIGHDTHNEVLIFTATPPYWINQWDTTSFKEVEDSSDDDQRFNVQIYDTLKVVENFVAIEPLMPAHGASPLCETMAGTSRTASAHPCNFRNVLVQSEQVSA